MASTETNSNATQPAPGKVLSPAKLAHVVLRTANFKPMVAFYKAFLGAHASYENDFLAFLTYDEEHHRIAIASVPPSPGPPPPSINAPAGSAEGGAAAAPTAGAPGRVAGRTSGLEHIAFTFSTLGDLLQAYRQRRGLGLLPLWSVNHGPTVSIYYQDPDGNQLETQVDAFASVEECNAAMRSEEFADNPFGVDFDPEELLAALEEGRDERELMRRPNIGPRTFESVPLLNPPAPDVGKVF